MFLKQGQKILTRVDRPGCPAGTQGVIKDLGKDFATLEFPDVDHFGTPVTLDFPYSALNPRDIDDYIIIDMRKLNDADPDE